MSFDAPHTTRRGWLKLVTLAITAAFAGLWFAVSRRLRAADRGSMLRLPAPARDGVSFHGPVVLVRQADRITALSARCPHLGCQISQQQGDQLVCPCHGSRFNLKGRVLEGPASADLTLLAIKREPKDQLVISIRR